MDRTDLQRLSKEQLIELVLRLQRPAKNSRTSSKPPLTDKKETRENSRPGGAKPGHEPHNRRLAEDPASVQDRDGAVPLLRASRASFPFVELVFADTAYAGKRVANATRIVVEIVRKIATKPASSCCPGAGWLKELSSGSTETDA